MKHCALVQLALGTVYVETFARLNFCEWKILKKFAFLFSRVELNNIRPQRVNKHFRELNFRECLVIREIRESLTARKFQRIRYVVYVRDSKQERLVNCQYILLVSTHSWLAHTPG